VGGEEIYLTSGLLVGGFAGVVGTLAVLAVRFQAGRRRAAWLWQHARPKPARAVVVAPQPGRIPSGLPLPVPQNADVVNAAVTARLERGDPPWVDAPTEVLRMRIPSRPQDADTVVLPKAGVGL
jgi:hypothetical protein